MNFLGMGSLEVFIILLVAFVVVGPQRMVEVARMLGKLMRDLRRMSAELPELIMDESEAKQARPPADYRRADTTPADLDREPQALPSPPAVPSPQTGQDSGAENGPVAFQPDGKAKSPNDTGPLEREQQDEA